jgi:hypothetical protein
MAAENGEKENRNSDANQHGTADPERRPRAPFLVASLAQVHNEILALLLYFRDQEPRFIFEFFLGHNPSTVNVSFGNLDTAVKAPRGIFCRGLNSLDSRAHFA